MDLRAILVLRLRQTVVRPMRPRLRRCPAMRRRAGRCRQQREGFRPFPTRWPGCKGRLPNRISARRRNRSRSVRVISHGRCSAIGQPPDSQWPRRDTFTKFPRRWLPMGCRMCSIRFTQRLRVLVSRANVDKVQPTCLVQLVRRVQPVRRRPSRPRFPRQRLRTLRRRLPRSRRLGVVPAAMRRTWSWVPSISCGG
jgi:hypothetical protein